HMVFFEIPDFKQIRENEYFVLTDPDIAPIKDCPSDFMDYFYTLLIKYPKFNKVGFSLKTDDIDEVGEYKKTIKRWEKQFYNRKINLFRPYLYNSSIDTTFALYRPQKDWQTSNFYKAIRTGFPYEARHLPWYKDFNRLSHEDKFYIASDIGSGNWNDSDQASRVYDRLCNIPEHFWEHLFSIKSSYRRTIIRFLGFKLTINRP
ncbi:MAG TPA: hypothetical protein DIC64_02920, partial [Alphaproteobacteria bacterium]|nr:hypothetical protein [Alphaproteobacteria bacterium]